jgi:hypothetical protein
LVWAVRVAPAPTLTMRLLPHRRAADRAEGELIRRKAAEEAAELAAKEAAWRAKMGDMNAATAAANATLLAFRAAERERERLMDAAVEGAPSRARAGGPGGRLCCDGGSWG